MHSNLAVLPSTNLTHLFGLLDIPLSGILPSYEPIPQLKAPSQSLIQIPPLLAQSHLEKRQNLSDLGNTIQKKVRYNPEVSLYATQIPSLNSHLTNGSLFLREKSFLEDQDTVIINYSNNRSTKTVQQPYKNTQFAEFEHLKHEPNQLQSMRKLVNRDRVLGQKDKEEVRSCDLSELIIPPLSHSMVSRKPVQKKDDDSSYQLQQALQDLQKKLASSQYQEAQTQSVKPYSSSLIFENSSSLPNYGQTNITNLAKNKVVELKNEKLSWNESPQSTSVETIGSCSASDQWESDFGVSQVETKYEEESNSNSTVDSIKSQRKQQHSSNVKNQEILVEKIIKEKAKTTTTQVVENGVNVKVEEKKVKIEEEIIKEESTETKTSRKTKYNPLFVSKWDMGSERRRNRWQTQEISPQKSEDLKKPSSIGSKSTRSDDDDEDEDLAETPVGEEYQAEITALCKKGSENKGKRCPKLKWDPSKVKKNQLEAYFKKMQVILDCPLNQEKAINLLVSNQNEPKKVYSHIEGREKEYIKEFKIRPRRIPEVPLFGDYRVLY